MNEAWYDVAIAGGGPAGCAAALALARRGVGRIVLVDAPRRDGRRIGESLPPEAGLLLRRLGVLDSFLADNHEPCLGSCSSWGDDALGYNDFLLNPHGNGWHLDRRRFDARLLDEAAAAGVEVRRERFSRGEIRARWTVDATGSAAAIARAAGARRLVADRLICVYQFFRQSAFPRLSMLEAVDAGWWYAAKLPEGEAVAMFASDRETAAPRFASLLAATKHIAPALAECTPIADTFRAAPAPSFVLDRAAGDDWIAVGDAASAYDPISAQGIYKALLDGILAADAIVAGDTSAYEASVRSRFEQYLANRGYFYRMEQRFAASPFWQRRASPATRPSP